MLNCSHHPSEVEIDNDITGIGVVIGYVATAGIVVMIILIHYLLSFQPRLDPFREGPVDLALDIRHRANPVDLIVLRPIRKVCIRLFGPHGVTLEAHSRLEQSLIKCMLSMSDIQIITGISILVSGAVQLEKGLSCYQWQVVVYLAWFSSLTHLSGLTLLRNYLFHRPAERVWRLCSMLVLIIMLVFAMVPTVNYKWLEGYETLGPSMADYALCHLRPIQRGPGPEKSFDFDFSNRPATLAVILSMLLLVLGFMSRLFKLHRKIYLSVDKNIRGNLSHFLRLWLRKLYIWVDIQGSPRGLKRMLLYRPLLALFLTGRLFFDLLSSMFFEVSWLIVSFLWGVGQLFATLSLYNGDGNGEWSFGQVMSVALLAIPLVTIIELLCPDNGHKPERVSNPESLSLPVEDTPAFLNLPGNARENLLHQAVPLQDEMSDHPDWDLYYDSGSLTVPLAITICGMAGVIFFVLFVVFNGAVKTVVFRFTFNPWGEVPLVLIFMTWSSILFSLMISHHRHFLRGLATMSRVLLCTILVGLPSIHFVSLIYRGIVQGYDMAGLTAFYVLCALIYNIRGRTVSP